MRVGDNIEGIAELDGRPVEEIATEQGLIRLPYGAVADISYTPSAAVLELLPHSDDRRTVISDRYYK